MDLSTNYLGLSLRNPVIVGSSGLTSTVEGVISLAKNGAGAVVLKSLFQEEILFESEAHIAELRKTHPDVQYFDYDGKKNPIDFYGYKVREDNINKYKDLIKNCKANVTIPVIASINCYYDSLEWISVAKDIEDAGADALELNMFFSPTDMGKTRKNKESMYFEIVEKITQAVSIPISLKISHYFTELGKMIHDLSKTEIKGLVLFNRFFSPDFDIDAFKVKPSYVFSDPSELAISLRWIAVMANKTDCDLSASTGIHDGDSVVKQLLAGADTVQVVSAIYKNGKGYIGNLLTDVEAWMEKHRFKTIADFKGKMSQEKSVDPKMYERTQFMKYFAKGGKV